MNKTLILLLVSSLIVLTACHEVAMPSSEAFNESRPSLSAAHKVKTAWYLWVPDYFNNQMYFFMRIMYDLFCFSVGLTYVFWLNDGGANFYKCYNSVPRNIQYLY